MNQQKSTAGASRQTSAQDKDKDKDKDKPAADSRQGKAAASHQKAGKDEGAGGGKKQARKH